MNTILEQITEWLKGMLIDGIMNNLSGMFDAVNQQVGDVAAQVGRSPSAFSPEVFSMVRNVSEGIGDVPNKPVSQSGSRSGSLKRSICIYRCPACRFVCPAPHTVSPGFFFLNQFARIAPEILCHTEKMAPGTVAIASDGNAVPAREAARPEFCMPISIVSALVCAMSSFNSFPSPNPQA